MKRSALSLLAIGLLLMGLSGCKKENLPSDARWLKTTCRGKYAGWTDSVKTNGWVVGKDIVSLFDPTTMDGFYYPWQGEDSLDFRIEESVKEIDERKSDRLVHAYSAKNCLWVNDKLVGGYYSELCLLPDSTLKNILTIEADYGYYQYISGRFDPERVFTIEALKRFSRLSVISTDIDYYFNQREQAINTLKMLPPGISVYLTYGVLSGEDVGELAGINELKSLNIWCYDMPPRGILQLAKVEKMRELNIIGGVQCKQLPYVQAFFLGLLRPDCSIDLSKR